MQRMTAAAGDATFRLIGAQELRRRLPFGDVVNALERACAGGTPSAPQRLSVSAGRGTILAMPAAQASAAGVKLATVQPENARRNLPVVHSVYVMFDPETLAPTALLDGAELTRIRTAAVSALATRHLSRPDAARLVVFGTGVQATAHVEALAAVRPIQDVTLVGRRPAAAQELARRLSTPDLSVRAGVPGDVADADIVCTCTTSTEPVFDGAALAPGVHVNAIGAFEPDSREVDETCVARARIAVDDRHAALAEGGDLVLAMRAGVIDQAAVLADLGEVVAGAPVRRDPTDITLFKSVGSAWQDLIVASMLGDDRR